MEIDLNTTPPLRDRRPSWTDRNLGAMRQVPEELRAAREARITHYASRAARGLPLFSDADPAS